MENTGTDEKTLDQTGDQIDRISQLHDEIIHHIMTYLQFEKEIARTSVLSQRWREIWLNFSTLIFYQQNFVRRNKNSHNLQEFSNQNEMFKKFVDESLQNRVKQNLNIHKMVLRVDFFDQEMAAYIDGWLRVATERNMRELDLHVTAYEMNLYTFPQSIIASERITELRVFGCNWDATCGLKLSNLQRLCLGELHLNEKIIENLVNCCPSLVDFRLIRCHGLECFLVSDLPKLNRVDLHFCIDLHKVELKAPKLETFWYYVHPGVFPSTISLGVCTNLKTLLLEDRYMNDKVFQSRFSSFHVLEKLTLNNCSYLWNITISSCCLKTLTVKKCALLKNVHVDAPNLRSLEYEGYIMPFSSLDPSNLNEAKFIFYPKVLCQSNTLWYSKFVDFLKKFDKSRGLKIVARTEKDVIVYEDMEIIYLPDCKHLEFEIVESYSCFDNLFEHVLSTWNPRTISIVSSSRSNLWKVACEKLNNRDKEPYCCKFNTFDHKCWCHCLKGFKVEDLLGYESRASSFSDRIDLKEPSRDETINDAVYDMMATDWISMLQKNAALTQQIICFKLLWNTCKHPTQMNLRS